MSVLHAVAAPVLIGFVIGCFVYAMWALDAWCEKRARARRNRNRWRTIHARAERIRSGQPIDPLYPIDPFE